MYKKGIENSQNIMMEALNQNKEALILAQYDDITAVPVKEHISRVREIERHYLGGKMSKLTLEFKNKIAYTVAYIDSSINVGSIVSTIGFLIEDGGTSSYYCKGGINRLFSTIEDIEHISYKPPYFNKVYRLGIAFELSEITAETIKYPLTDENLKPLDDVDKFYYVIQEKRNSMIEKAKGIADKARNTLAPSVDTSTLLDVKDEEDYPDEDVSFDVGETNNNE